MGGGHVKLYPYKNSGGGGGGEQVLAIYFIIIYNIHYTSTGRTLYIKLVKLY